MPADQRAVLVVGICSIAALLAGLLAAYLPAPSERRARRRGGLVDESVFRKIRGGA